MATKTKAAKEKKVAPVYEQKLPDGEKVTFLGYSNPKDAGPMKEGTACTIVGFDTEQDVYVVRPVGATDDSSDETVFIEELEVAGTEEAPKTKGKKTKGKKAKAPVSEEQEASKATKTGKQKAAKQAPVEVEPEDEERGELAEPGEIVLPPFKATTSVKRAMSEHNDDALEAALDLVQTKEKTVFTLGGILAFIKRNDLQTKAAIEGDEDGRTYESGLKGFNAYAFDRLGIAPRPAHAYVSLYEMFSQVCTESQIENIGWTKLREMLPLRDLLTKDNVAGFLEFAKGHSTREVRDEVTEKLVSSGAEVHGNTKKDKAKLVTYKLHFHQDQANVVNEALDKARQTIGEDRSESEALIYIIEQWMLLSGSEG